MVTTASTAVLAPFMNDIRNYGAVSGENCTAAFAAMMDVVLAGNVNAFIPKGDWYVDDIYENLSLGEVKFGIIGEHQAFSRIITTTTNNNGVLNLYANSRSCEVLLENFSIIAQGVGGKGLVFGQPEGGSQSRSTIKMRNVSVRSVDKTSKYFDTFVGFPGSWYAQIKNCEIIGLPNNGLTDASNTFKPGKLLDLDSAYGPNISDCYIKGGYRAISNRQYVGTVTSVADNGSGLSRITVSNGPHPFSTGTEVHLDSLGAPYDGNWTSTKISDTQFDINVSFTSTATGEAWVRNGPEGFRLEGCTLEWCRIGIDVMRRSGLEPAMYFNDSHINFRDVGIWITGASQITIDNIIFYNEDSGAEYSGTPYDIFGEDMGEFTIQNCKHRYAGNAARVCVQIEDNGLFDSGDRGRIINNVYACTAAKPGGLGSGTTYITIMDNTIKSTGFTSTLFTDSGTNNLVQTDLYGKEVKKAFTPSISFGGGSTGITYATQDGEWTLAGSVLHLWAEIELTSKGTDTGDIEVAMPTNLPIGLNVVQDKGHAVATLDSNVASVAATVIGRPIDPDSLYLVEQGATGTSQLDDTNFTNTSRFVISGTFLVE